MTIPPNLAKLFKYVMVPSIEQLQNWSFCLYIGLSALWNLIALVGIVITTQTPLPFFTWLFALAPFQLFCVVWFLKTLYLDMSGRD
jgi:hypothetical protein